MNSVNISDFTEDRDDALKVEYEVLRIIQRKYPTARKIVGNHSAFDIEVPQITTIEVKHDIKSSKTDNFFIEHSMNEKDSGIIASTAEWWIIVDEEGYYFITREALLHLLKSNYCNLRGLKGTDGTTMTYRLIKKDIVRNSPYCSFFKRGVST
jgi:hypothetical protein